MKGLKQSCKKIMGLFDKIAQKAKETAAAATNIYEGYVKDKEETDGIKTVDLKKWAETLDETLEKYSSRFNVDEMWNKLRAVAAKVGQDMVLMVLTMYYTIRDNIKGSQVVNNVKHDVPISDVLLLVGAIAYFVCPADLIPDGIVGIGFSDDLTALTYAYKKSNRIFTAAAKGTALEKTSQLFGKHFNPEMAALLTKKYSK